MNHLKYFQLFAEGMDGSLYHSCRVEYGIKSLKNNKMLASTKQFFFKNNNRGGNRDEIVANADRLYGISTTRSKNLAYGGITFVFSKEKLKTKYRVVPFDFDGMFGVSRKSTSPRHSKFYEREEFVVVSKYEGRYLEPLDRYLVGFYLSEDPKKSQEFKNSSNVEYLTNHHLFLGYYDGSKFFDREISADSDFRKQMNKISGLRRKVS